MRKFTLLLNTFFLGTLISLSIACQQGPPAERMTAGEAVYKRTCIACHMANGMGAPNQNPPLANTDWVTGDQNRLITIVLEGMTEPVEVNGERYTNIMAPHDFLSDQEIADVLTYIRNSFGNQASEIMPEQVAALRTGTE